MTRRAGAGALLAAGVAMLCWSWGTWPDVLVDFGRELYVAWQLSAGKVLYVDLAYFNGPLSPYLNASWFRLFGVSLRTLALANVGIAVLLAWLLYRLLSDIGSSLAAVAGCLTFVTVFAFGQLIYVGNYNFVCPYAHELTHGVVLGLAAIVFLSRYQRSHDLTAVAGLGLALGLCFLTKPETFLAAGLAVAVGFGLTIWSEPPPGRRLWSVLAVAAGCTALPPLAALALLCLAMPARQALAATWGAWPWVLRGDVAALRLYQLSMGTLDPAFSAKRIALWTAMYLAASGVLAGLGLVARTRRSRRVALGVLAACIVMLHLVAWYAQPKPWLVTTRPGPLSWFFAAGALPVVTILLALGVLAGLVRRWREPMVRPRLILQLTALVFAATLLGKMLFNGRIYHYGFALGMPAVLMVVTALVDWLPRRITAWGGDGRVTRAAALGLLTVVIAIQLRIVHFWFSQKSHRVAAGADAFWADARGPLVSRMLDEIAWRVPPNATLTALPEGAMLNYLTRRTDPVPYLTYVPPMVTMFGEGAMLEAFRAAPPDYIALVHKDTTEHGFRFFGRDYGRRIYGWIRRNYRPVTLVGARPLRDERFGILLLRRRLPT